MASSVINTNPNIINEHLDKIINLYFQGYSVTNAIKVVRNETIQTSRGCTRTN